MDVLKFVRKPFYVEAVQVTIHNMVQVAMWCGGEVHVPRDAAADDFTKAYIKVEVLRPANERQTQATVGDWLVRAGRGFKVYTDHAMRSSFDPTEEEAKNTEYVPLSEVNKEDSDAAAA